MKSEKRYLALAVLSVMVMIALLFSIRISPARDLDGRFANSPLKSWFDHLASGKGLCCSFADGAVVDDPDWEVHSSTGGAEPNGTHYRVRIEGEWIDVPDEAVITEPNRAGHTMVWPYYGDGKILYIRCFMPGSMT
jgi:hypothetical protein